MIGVDVRLEVKCDKCKKIVRNHYPITAFDADIEDELEKLAELNDFTLDGEAALCPTCQ